MTRAVPEWIAKRDDETIPPRVRVRVFDRYNEICQCGCGIKIRPGMKWEADHKVALINGGEHRERNLVPLLVDHHKIKTAQDMGLKSKTYKRRAKHLGVKARQSIKGWRKFDGTPVKAEDRRR